jgi:flavin-dependent dehydrogenase
MHVPMRASGTTQDDRTGYDVVVVGAGLIGGSLAELEGLDVPVRQEIVRASFTARGQKTANRSAGTRLLSLVDRSEFDAALLQHATALGAQVRSGVTVTAVTRDVDGALLSTSAGPIRARWSTS